MKRMTAAALIAVMLALSCLAGAAASQTGGGKEAANQFAVPLFAREYKENFVKWKKIAESGKAALYCGLLIEDAVNACGDAMFDAKNIRAAYAFDFAGALGTAVYASGSVWALYCQNSDTGFFSSLGELDEKYFDEMVGKMAESGVWLTPVRLPVEEVIKAAAYVPPTADMIREASGDIGLFRTADRVNSFSLGWAAFQNQDVSGYISPDGRVLTGDWNFGRSFDSTSGTAIVYRGVLKRGSPNMIEGGLYEGVLGIIDTDGDYVLPMEYPYITSLVNGVALLKTADGQELLYDLADRRFIVPEEEGVCHFRNHLFNNDLIPAFRGKYKTSGTYGSFDDSEGKWGLIDRQGRTVVPFEYDSGYFEWYNGLSTAKKNGKYGVIDTKGNQVIPFTWDSIAMNGASIVASRDGKKYLLNEKGVIAYAFEYKTVNPFEWGCFEVYDDYSEGKAALIDGEGRFLLAPEWHGIRPMNDHIAVVYRRSGDRNLYGAVNYRTGETVLPVSFDSFGYYFHEDRVVFKQLGYYGYADGEFNVVIQPQYLDCTDFSEGLAAVKDDGGWKIIDAEGNVIR